MAASRPLILRERFLAWDETTALVLAVAFFIIPMVTHSVLIYSVLNHALIGMIAAQSVWIMLRMNLLTFATPAFMALGGYTVAIAGQYEITDAFAMTAAAFLVPALVAVPLGALVLRLRGTYFVLVTFVLSQIMQLVLFQTPALTGGSNGIAGIPAVTLFGTDMMSHRQVLMFACGIALVSTVIAVALTRYFRRHFAAIEESDSSRNPSAWWCGATRRWASWWQPGWRGWRAIRWSTCC